MRTQITPEVRRAIAVKVGVHEQYLYQCLTGRRDMKPSEARRIEAETAGQITRQMLCQKTWAGIWPELERPQKIKRPTAETKEVISAETAPQQKEVTHG